MSATVGAGTVPPMPTLERSLAAAAALCGALALSTLLRAAARTAEVAATNAERLGYEMGGVAVALAGFALAGALLLPGSARERLGWRPGRLSAGHVALLVLGTFALSHALNGLLVQLDLVQHSALSGIAGRLSGTRGLALAVALVGMAAGPGLGEELLCRGLLQRSLVPTMGAPLGIGVASLVFGALHMEPIHASTAAVLGLYLGILAHRADSTRPAILAHVLNNTLAVLGNTGVLVWAPPLSVSVPSGFAIAAVCLVWARPRPPSAGPPPGDSRAAGSDAASLQPSERTVDG